MKKLSLSLLLMGLVCLSGQASGQATWFPGVAQTTTTVTATNTTVLVPLSGATITFCGYPYNGSLPCTNKASVCPDITGVGCTTGAPNNPITADALGNFGAWLPSGSYDYTVCAVSGVCQGPYHAVIGTSNGANGNFTVDGVTYTTIQAAITAAGTTGYVVIPSSYAGTDTYTNPNRIQINDRRTLSNRYRGFINVLTDCGLKGDGVTDDGPAIQACFDAFPQYLFHFPKTVANGCSYFSNQTLFPKGSGVIVEGETGSQYLDDVVSGHMGGVEVCFPTGVTGFWWTIGNTQGGIMRDIALHGASGIKSLTVPTAINIPAALPQTTRSISAIQRAANVLSVTITRTAGGEGMNIQVGSTVKITGVVGDTTMNGECVISTLGNLGGGTTTANPSSFTCPQNGSDAGPFGAVGSTILPTTGVSADGIRICTNFVTIDHVGVSGFERHGLNADSTSGNGCASPFSDDLIVRNSMFMENNGSGVLCRGVDCNAHLYQGDTFYYNFLWGVEDQSSLGNTHVGNQISNNGHQWAITSTPATKNISTISRTLSGGDSTVTVVLSQADTNLKLGSCVVIVGVTDTSFNTANVNPSGCYFITSYTDSTHFQYIQPGRPVDASSSGGTERMAKFSEAYLSAGVDDGAEKIDTQSAISFPLILNQYIEGSQNCKSFGAMHILGASIPTCSPAQDFEPSILTTTCPTLGGNLCFRTPNSFTFQKATDAADNVITLKSGISVYKGSRIEWWDKDNVINWKLNGSTSASSGASAFWDLSSGAGQSRITILGAGNTYINGEGPGGKVIFNKNFGGANAGTGGIEVQSGGASPAAVATIDATGLGTFNGGVKVAAAISPTVAGAQTAGTNALPFSSIFVGAAATNNAQLTGTFTAARVHTLPDVTGNVEVRLTASDAAVDLASVASAACTAERTVAVTGAAFGDAVDVTAGTALEAGGFLIGKVSSAGNTKWQFCNLSGGAIDRASDTYTIKVRK